MKCSFQYDQNLFKAGILEDKSITERCVKVTETQNRPTSYRTSPLITCVSDFKFAIKAQPLLVSNCPLKCNSLASLKLCLH